MNFKKGTKVGVDIDSINGLVGIPAEIITEADKDGIMELLLHPIKCAEHQIPLEIIHRTKVDLYPI